MKKINKFKNNIPIYLINLKRDKERLDKMKKQFKDYGVSNYHVFEAVDGNKDNLEDMVGNFDKMLISKSELSCTISHIKAMQYWLQNSNSEYAIFMEDDISFETVDLWPWTFSDFLSKIDAVYNMLQLSIIHYFKVNTSIHLREKFDWSTLCYLVNRERAEEIIKTYFIDKKYYFPISPDDAVADMALYRGAVCYSFPLFVDRDEGSSIVDSRSHFHKNSREQVLKFWASKPKSLKKSMPKHGV